VAVTRGEVREQEDRGKGEEKKGEEDDRNFLISICGILS